MTEDEYARMITSKVWPRYLKAKNSDKGQPSAIAFGQDIYPLAVKVAESFVNLAKPNQAPTRTMMGMDIVRDDALAEGEWELRWAE